MSFNSYVFILAFFPVVLLGYFAFHKWNREKEAVWYLIGMSLLFCGYFSLQSVAVLLFSVFLNYGISRWMSPLKGQKRKLLLALGITADVGLLFCFKYYNFFIENVNGLTGLSLSGWELAMPLGISFYTFGQLSYLIDAYRAEEPEASFLEYLAFVVFFPKLVQGPIMRFGEFFPQLREKKRKTPDFQNLSKGLYAFSLGLAKKVLLADTLAKIVNIGYNDPEVLVGSDALLVMVCYSLQIYFDFSGYCDMAYGVGCALNIELPLNFNSPYKAVSVSDFWDRWHMTLTGFFTRYLYIPLGGSRKGKTRTLINIMLVFLVSGLWHGASWSFVLWGALNGALMVFERLTGVEDWKLPKLVKQMGTFCVATFAWSIFRAPKLSVAVDIWKKLFTGGFTGIGEPILSCFDELLEMKLLARLGLLRGAGDEILLILFVLLLVLACFFMKHTQQKAEGMKFTKWKLFVTVGLLLWSILSLSDISEFIYVNF